LTQYYNKIETYQDFPQAELDKISHFFEHYKDLEKGKWGWVEKNTDGYCESDESGC
jgi:inorganic pyrophosphatase